ncbi:MAG: alpha/beta hydrolase family protein, partial [Alphaproteobacteria bacterium]
RRMKNFALNLVPVGLALLLAALAAAETPGAGPQGPEQGPYREQAWRVPVTDSDGSTPRLLEALLFRPPGEARRPLVIISHGTPRRSDERAPMRPHWAERAAAFFVAEGYAVIAPMRRGYGRSPGDADERTPGGCANPDYADIGRRVARQLLDVADFMRRQPFVAADKIVLAGQSAGGFASLAAAAENPAGIVAVINFAGGRGSRGTDDVCGEDRLVAAMSVFGAGTRVPSIWLYSENDSYFRPELARRMHAAYARGGARSSLHILGAYGSDGHGFVRRGDSEAEWHPLARDFLTALGTGAVRADVPAFPDTAPRFERLAPGGAQ